MRRMSERKRKKSTKAIMSSLCLAASVAALALSGCGVESTGEVSGGRSENSAGTNTGSDDENSAGTNTGNGAGINSGTAPEYMEIVDDMAPIILTMDQESLAYDQILEKIGTYVEDPQAVGAEETRELVQAAIADFESASQEAEPYAMEEDFAKLLIAWGIDPEEYQMNADARESNLGRYITRLQTMDGFLELEAWYENTEADSDFAYMYEYNLKEQECLRGYEYYSANYWFADWEEEAAAYAQEQIAGKLQSFVTEASVWESSRQAVEQKMLVYLEELEDQTEEMAAHIGQAQEELYRLEKELNEQLEGGGE